MATDAERTRYRVIADAIIKTAKGNLQTFRAFLRRPQGTAFMQLMEGRFADVHSERQAIHTGCVYMFQNVSNVKDTQFKNDQTFFTRPEVNQGALARTLRNTPVGLTWWIASPFLTDPAAAHHALTLMGITVEDAEVIQVAVNKALEAAGLHPESPRVSSSVAPTSASASASAAAAAAAAAVAASASASASAGPSLRPVSTEEDARARETRHAVELSKMEAKIKEAIMRTRHECAREHAAELATEKGQMYASHSAEMDQLRAELSCAKAKILSLEHAIMERDATIMEMNRRDTEMAPIASSASAAAEPVAAVAPSPLPPPDRAIRQCIAVADAIKRGGSTFNANILCGPPDVDSLNRITSVATGKDGPGRMKLYINVVHLANYIPAWVPSSTAIRTLAVADTAKCSIGLEVLKDAVGVLPLALSWWLFFCESPGPLGPPTFMVGGVDNADRLYDVAEAIK